MINYNISTENTTLCGGCDEVVFHYLCEECDTFDCGPCHEDYGC